MVFDNTPINTLPIGDDSSYFLQAIREGLKDIGKPDLLGLAPAYVRQHPEALAEYSAADDDVERKEVVGRIVTEIVDNPNSIA